MDDDVEIRSMKLCAIPYSTRTVLSCLLDTPKIIPADGPDKLPRDWRGLASLVNIPAELEANIHHSNDKTNRVLEVFQRDKSATVGTLLDFLQRLDRYDVYDDVLADLRKVYANKWDPSGKDQNHLSINNNHVVSDWEDSGVITYDDRPGYEHQYHAYVLYAQEDHAFVDEMLRRLQDFKICTEANVQAGHATQYAPIAKLISERCQRIILVCSPAFLNSSANTFFSNYAQAVSIETGKRKIIPIMYQQCQLPDNLKYYHKLHYSVASGDDDRPMYDFWAKLRQSLQQLQPAPAGLRAVNGAAKHHLTDHGLLLPPSRSLNDLPSLLPTNVATEDAQSDSNVSRISEGKLKKPGVLRRIKGFMSKGKKTQSMVAN